MSLRSILSATALFLGAAQASSAADPASSRVSGMAALAAQSSQERGPDYRGHHLPPDYIVRNTAEPVDALQADGGAAAEPFYYLVPGSGLTLAAEASDPAPAPAPAPGPDERSDDVPEALEQAPAAGRQRGIWAAIAYSEQDGEHGFFWGADQRAEAEDAAFAHCERAGGEGCAVVAVFRNHRHWNDDDGGGFPYNRCGALALGPEVSSVPSSWGASSATSRAQAEAAALRQCEADGAQCAIKEWVCT